MAVQNRINVISVSSIWCCPCVESSLLLLGKGVCYDLCVVLANSNNHVGNKWYQWLLQAQVKELTAKGQHSLESDGNVLYLDCGDIYTIIHLSKLIELYILNG